MTALDLRGGHPPKGLPAPSATSRSGDDFIGRSALDGSFSLPLLLLRDADLRWNISTMAEYCRAHELSLAPHLKTHMSPQITALQIEAGAWGMSVATAWQAEIARAFGVRRILIANEVVDVGSVRALRRMVSQDDVDIYCFVDSIECVRILSADMRGLGSRRRVNALVELGMEGGRCGARSVSDAIAIAEAVHDSEVLTLVGTAGFEQIARAPTQAETLALVDSNLAALRDLTQQLATAGMFDAADEVLVSAGGSKFFDRVAAILAGAEASYPRITARVVVRSGVYALHDIGPLAVWSALDGRRVGPTKLRPALRLFAAVLSRPEPTLAVVGFGRRDASDDHGPPRPLELLRGTKDRWESRAPSEAMHIEALNDQHAYLRLAVSDDVRVGDVISFGIAHPCTTLDRWRLLPRVNEGNQIVDFATCVFT